MISLFTQINLSSQTPPPDSFISGFQTTAEFAYSASNAGDVNGDGFEDIIVGARYYDNTESNEGRVYIFHGSATGIITTPALTLEINQANAYFGFSSDGAGDVNNDGYDDIIIGAYAFDEGQTDEGKVFIYHGSSSGILPTPVATMQSNQVQSYFGYSVAGAHDINNDGYDDVIVGAPYYNNGEADEGMAFLYLGSPSGINTTPVNSLESNDINGYLGISVDGAGDVNADGFSDLVLGEDHMENFIDNEGGALIFYGNDSGVNNLTFTIIDSDQTNAYLGTSVSEAGDINNDGYDDIVVGAPNFDNGQSNEGRAFIYYGSSTGITDPASVTIESNQISGFFGSTVRNAGDFNNDGFSDIIIASDVFDNGQTSEGKAFLYKGSAAGLITTPFLTFESDQAYAGLGRSLSSADINNDGFSEILVGANLFDAAYSASGSLFIYNGASCIPQIYYADYDNDGFGNQTDSFTLCNSYPEVVNNHLDCNDADSFQNPLTVWYIDVDLDQYYNGTGLPLNQCIFPGGDYSYNIIGAGDCNDLNFWSNPEVTEIADLIDNNCNGEVDEALEFSYGGMLQSNQINSNFAVSVSNLGDINNDGFDDLIIGASEFDNGQTDEGLAFVYHGSSTGINIVASTVLEANVVGARYGTTVASAGDVNGDGYMDGMVGAPEYDGGGGDLGRVYFYYGSPSGFSTTANLIITGIYGSGKLGCDIAAAGDMNNDGYDDVILNTTQHAKIYYGSSTGISPIEHPVLYHVGPGEANASVSGAGDINDDGYDDVIVGEPSYSNGEPSEGAIAIFYGSAAGMTYPPGDTLESNISFSSYGFALSKAGDINNDGYSDIVVGAHLAGGPYSGKIYTYLGSATGIIETPQNEIEGNEDYTNFGNSVSGIGDINGDGFSDVMAGGYLYDTEIINNGRVTTYHGSPTGIDTTYSSIFFGDQSNAYYSYSICGGGDYNGDDIPDIAVGAYDYTLGETNEGVAFIYYGNDLCTPGAEICNSLDDNCNGLIDDGVAETISISAGGPITFCQGGNVLLTATYSGATVQWKKNDINIPGATSPTYLVTTKATYTCVTTSPCGTATSAGIFVNVNKNPPASITAGGATTFCAGGSVVLTANAGGGLSYQWYKGASLIAGATSINYTATIAGNYKCRVAKTATGCFKNSNVIGVSVPCKEGEMLNDENAFTIYPNPNDGTFTIEAIVKTQDFASQELTTIEIYNNLGQLIYSKEVNVPDGIINELIEIKNVIPGVYLVKLSNNGILDFKNIVIE